jgi:hypothetical protein
MSGIRADKWIKAMVDQYGMIDPWRSKSVNMVHSPSFPMALPAMVMMYAALMS